MSYSCNHRQIFYPNMEPTADGVSTTATPTTENSDPSIRQKRTRDGTRYQELLNAEKLDESGKLESHFKPRNPIKPRQPKPKPAASNADSDSSDIEFLPVPSLDENSDSEGEEEDDGDDVDITDEEIAASLPRKLVFKRKCTKGASRKSVTKKSRHNDSSENLQTHLPDSEESKKPVKMRKKTNPIYLFYKHLKEAPQGNH
ncbi:hypothetical protein BDQ17DRAFT_1484194 [Cyathus striatus]|nr:hypothetical protein BDQ17DRAFT_1484194 [Cyathus striatus]